MHSYAGKRLTQYFESMGLKSVGNSVAIGLPGHPVLVFEGEGSIIAVLAVSKDELIDRNALIRAVVRSTSLSGKANKVYLAMPRAYASSIDSDLLREHGVGLLTFDERRVAEALPAKELEVMLESANREAPASTSDDIADLKQRVASLERAIGSMEDMTGTLQGEIEKLRTEMVGITAARIPVASEKAPVVTRYRRVNKGLPSYLQENPWVEVLVERGES